MATAKYNPNPINYGIIPKQWLNTPVMSSEEAFMELEKLQNAELANEINSVNAEVAARKNQAQKEAIDEYEKAMEIKRGAGEPELLSSDDAMALARKYQIKSGDPSGLADDELKRLQIQSLDEERKRRAEEDKYITKSRYSDLVEIDKETGIPKVLLEGKEPVNKGSRPRWLINPDTMEVGQYSGDEADALEAQGFISTGRANAEKLAGDIKMRKRYEERAANKNPAGGSENKKQEKVIDFTIPPDAKKVEYSKDGTKVKITHSNGRVQIEDLK